MTDNEDMCVGCEEVPFSPDWSTGEGPYVCPKCATPPPETFIGALKGLLDRLSSDIFYDADNYEDILASENLRTIQMFSDYLSDHIKDPECCTRDGAGGHEEMCPELKRCKDSCHEGELACLLPCDWCEKYCDHS